MTGQNKRNSKRWAEMIEKASAPKVDVEKLVHSVASQAGVTIKHESA